MTRTGVMPIRAEVDPYVAWKCGTGWSVKNMRMTIPKNRAISGTG